MKENYQLKTDEIIQKINKEEKVPKLLLHSCCAPCSSYVLSYLSSYFQITVFYYNPNIYPEEEYQKRKKQQIRFIKEFKTKYPVDYLDCDYKPNEFFDTVKGLEKEKEGNERCTKCYYMRMKETAKQASLYQYDYFSTTLSVSPYKNADKINKIGSVLEKEYHIPFLYADFKKRNGYKQSISLSKEYQLYRQNYCGCVFSKQASLEKKDL